MGGPDQRRIPSRRRTARRSRPSTPATARSSPIWPSATRKTSIWPVRAALAAYPAWKKKTGAARAKLLMKLAQLVEANGPKLAELESLNAGKPIRDSKAIDAVTAIDALEYFAGMATKIQGDTIPVPGPYINMTLREPLGVIGGIIPWNYPLLQAVWKIAPAIAAGNTVVVKPAEQACLSVMLFGKLCTEAGIPAGVVNIVPGYGAVAGAALVASPHGRQGDVHRLDHDRQAHRRARPPTRSSRSASSSAARAPSSCSRTPRSIRRRRSPRCRSSATWARSAPPARACSCTRRCTTRCWRRSSRTPRRSSSATRWIRPPPWAR